MVVVVVGTRSGENGMVAMAETITRPRLHVSIVQTLLHTNDYIESQSKRAGIGLQLRKPSDTAIAAAAFFPTQASS